MLGTIVVFESRSGFCPPTHWFDPKSASLWEPGHVPKLRTGDLSHEPGPYCHENNYNTASSPPV